MSTPNLSGNFAVSLWFKANNFNTDVNEIITNPNNGIGGFGLSIGNSGTTLDINSPNVFPQTLCSYNFSTGTWYHIVISRNNGSFSAWINGVNQNVTYQDTYDFSGPIALGWDNNNPYYAFDGIIDEVGIWTKFLTNQNVADLYNNGLGVQYPFTTPPSNLLNGIQAYWKLDDDGSGNVSLVDSTNNGNTLTNNGNIQLGTGIIYGAANYDWTNNQYLNNDNFSNTGDYTISCWVKFNSMNADNGYPSIFAIGYNGGTRINPSGTPTGNCSYYDNSIYGGPAGTYNWNIGSWDHFVLTCNSSTGTIKTYLNGNLNTENTTGNNYDFTGVQIGLQGALNTPDASIDEFGIWNRTLSQNEINSLYNNGIGLSYPFSQTAITGLKDGTLAYWKLDEASGTRYDSTINGYNLIDDVNVTSGFGIISSAAVFDGSNVLTIPAASYPDLNDVFSISCWVKTSNQSEFIGAWNGGGQFVINTTNYPTSNGNFGVSLFNQDGSSDNLGSSIFGADDVWHHVVLTLDGTTAKLYVDGTFQDSRAFTYNDYNSIAKRDFYIGNLDNFGWTGSVDEVGIWNRALSQEEVTTLYNAGEALSYPFIPTSGLSLWLDASDSNTTLKLGGGPYTSDSNTSLLMHFDGGDGSTTFIDSSNNNLTVSNTNGTPVISTTQSKFGGSSLYLDGSSNLQIDEDSVMNLSNTPFTIEAWFYALSLPSDIVNGSAAIISKDTYGSNFDWCVGIAQNGFVFVTSNAAVILFFNATVETNKWNHVAYVHDGTSLSVYLNGNLVGSPQAVSVTDASPSLTIGCANWNNPNGFFNGYIEELRVVKGVAIPPTAPVTDGEPILKWSDKSGNNNHATQSNGSLKPVLATNTLNGKPTIYFDGTGKEFNLTNDIGGNIYSLFIVTKNNDNTAGSMFFWNNQNNNSNYVAIITDTGWNPIGRNKFIISNQDNGSGYNNSDFAYSGLLATNDFFLGSIVRSGTSIGVGLNGVNGDVEGSFTRTDVINKIGGYPFGYELDGNVAEIIAYNRALSDTEKQDVETYLNEKYNLYTVPPIVQDGLVLWLDADDTRSYPGTGNTWYDLSPSNNNGNLNYGVTFNSGVMQFDGSNGYVNFGSYTPTSDSFTLEVVFNWGRFGTSNIDFVFSGNFEQIEFHTGGDTGTNGLRFAPAGNGSTPGGTSYYLDETNIIDSGTNHITYVWDANSSTAYLYKNGVFVTSSVLSKNSIKTLQALNLGRRQSASSYYFQGDVHITRLYNRALNSTEVAKNFEVSRSRFGL